MQENIHPSWLLLLHVTPSPENNEIRALVNGVSELASIVVGDYTVEVVSLWVSDLDIISLDDLDRLPLST